MRQIDGFFPKHTQTPSSHKARAASEPVPSDLVHVHFATASENDEYDKIEGRTHNQMFLLLHTSQSVESH